MRLPLGSSLAVGLVIAGCAADPYPFLATGPGAHQSAPAAVGQPVPAVLAWIEPRPGDRITFLGADLVEPLDGATVEFLFSPPIHTPDGGTLIGETLEPLAGAGVTGPQGTPGPDNAVGIVARLTATKAGRYEIPRFRLRFRINDGPERSADGGDVVLLVCAADPAPADCNESPPP